MEEGEDRKQPPAGKNASVVPEQLTIRKSSKRSFDNATAALPHISNRMWKRIKSVSKRRTFRGGIWTKTIKEQERRQEKRMLKHIALLHRFKIRDHNEDVLDRGLIEAEKKLSLDKMKVTKSAVRGNMVSKCSPLKLLCSPKLAIDPQSRLKKVLMTLQTLSLLYLGFLLPFELFFISYNAETYTFKDRAALMSGFEVTIDVIFMVAFAAKFYTPYVRAEDGVWEVSPGRISRHVLLKADFIILFFCTIPMGLIAVLLGESMPLLIWRFLQVCARYYACIDNKTMINPEKIFKNFSHQIGFLSTLTKSLLLILGFLHWSTCFWYYLHPAEDILMISSANYIAYQKSHEYDQNVLPEAEREVSGHLNNIFDMQVTLYFRFAYETLSIVVGDQVEGTTPRQYAFLYSMTFLGVCMVAGLFGQVGNIIASQNKERMLYLEKMNDSVRTMRYLQLPDTVIERVIRYHEYIYNVFGGFTPNKINQFADQLSMPLRAEVKLHCHTNLISRVALFDKLDANISRYLIDCLKIEIYMPGDYVVREGEYDSSLFMIVKGVCQVFMHGKEKAVATLRQGDYFGEISLVTRQARTATVRAETFCNFAVINKDDYDRIKQAHQDAFSETEKIVMAKLKKYTGLKNEIKRSASNHLGSESESEADKAKSTEVPSPHSSLRGLPPINKGSKEPALHTTSATNNSLSSGLGMVAKLAKKGRKAKRAKTGQLVLDKLDFLIKAVEKNAKGVWLLQQQLEGRETPRK